MTRPLMVAAGYLDLSQPHKLALMKIADSVDDPESRIGFPGVDAVRLWTGAGRSHAMQLIKDLQEMGLVMQVAPGFKGSRASYKVFPDPGDEVASLAARRGTPCPGARLFKGVPAIPSAEEVKARVDALDAAPRRWNKAGAAAESIRRKDSKGSAGADPMGAGAERPSGATGGVNGSARPDPYEANGSARPDPMSLKGSASPDPYGSERVRNEPPKGPELRSIGSAGADPFKTLLQNQTLQSQNPEPPLRDDPASEDPQLPLGVEEGPPVEAKDPRVVQAMPCAREIVTSFMDWWKKNRGMAEDKPIPDGTRAFHALVGAKSRKRDCSFVTAALLDGYTRNEVARALSIWADPPQGRKPYGLIPAKSAWVEALAAVAAGRTQTPQQSAPYRPDATQDIDDLQARKRARRDKREGATAAPAQAEIVV